jgi:phytoene synthase
MQLSTTDPERFVTTLFAPREKRAGLAALYAFNFELGSVRERAVREPMAGHIRLQWWRDALASGGGGAPLAEAVLGLGLAVDDLLAMVDAREGDLSPDAPASMADLEAYAASTGGALQALAARFLGGDEAVCAMARHAGTAYALQGLMRALPAHAAIGRRHLPLQALPEEISAPSAALSFAVEQVVQLAASHLDQVPLASMPRATRAAGLCALQAATHLKRLKRAGYNPFAPRLAIPAPRPLALWWASFRA